MQKTIAPYEHLPHFQIYYGNRFIILGIITALFLIWVVIGGFFLVDLLRHFSLMTLLVMCFIAFGFFGLYHFAKVSIFTAIHVFIDGKNLICINLLAQSKTIRLTGLKEIKQAFLSKYQIVLEFDEPRKSSIEISVAISDFPQLLELILKGSPNLRKLHIDKLLAFSPDPNLTFQHSLNFGLINSIKKRLDSSP